MAELEDKQVVTKSDGNIRVSAHVTAKVNMGNYETVEVGFGVERDKFPTEKNTAEALENTYAMVDAAVQAKVDELVAIRG